MPFIIETIVTTIGQDGRMNFAPMGVVWGHPHLVIRPYVDTTTYRNLVATREAVVNLTDNVLIFATAALTDPELPYRPAAHVRGAILHDACSYYEVVADEIEDATERASVRCHVIDEGLVRQFLGFNRAKSAVIEATILATRLRWLVPEEVHRLLRQHAGIVEKTGGEQERAALAVVERYIDAWFHTPQRA